MGAPGDLCEPTDDEPEASGTRYAQVIAEALRNSTEGPTRAYAPRAGWFLNGVEGENSLPFAFLPGAVAASRKS